MFTTKNIFTNSASAEGLGSFVAGGNTISYNLKHTGRIVMGADDGVTWLGTQSTVAKRMRSAILQ